MNSAIFPGLQGGPLMHVIAAKAVAMKIAATEEFRERQRATIVNAQAFAEELIAVAREGSETVIFLYSTLVGHHEGLPSRIGAAAAAMVSTGAAVSTASVRADCPTAASASTR